MGRKPNPEALRIKTVGLPAVAVTKFNKAKVLNRIDQV